SRVSTYTCARDPLVEAGREEEQDLQMKVAYVRRQILATPNLERVARETDLDLRAADPAAFQELVADLQDEITVRSEGESSRRGGRFEANVYNIIYQDPDRQTAQRVVQSLLNTFQEQSLEGDLREDVQALEFLDDQASTYRDRLEAAESRVADFKRQNAGILGEGGGFFSRLASLQDERRQIRADLRIEQDRRRALQEQLRLSQSESSTQESGTASIAELEAQIVAAEKNLDELRLRYTDQHPSVISARETLGSLRERLEKRQEELGPLLQSGSGTGALVENVRMALANARLRSHAGPVRGLAPAP
ncbi:MAG: hypothetical protein P8102_14490, partial [Gammaproteobacteria bacterium]